MIIDSLVRMFGRPFGIIRYHAYGRDVRKVVPPLVNLLASAQTSIKMATGEMYFGVYNDPKIVEIIESKINRGVSVEIVHSPEIDPQTTKIPKLAKQGKLKMYRLYEEPKHHFWIIDGVHVLDEDPHAPREKERKFYIIKNAGFLAETLSREFEKRMIISISKYKKSKKSK